MSRLYALSPSPVPLRHTRRTIIFAFLIAHLVLTIIVNLGLFAGNAFRPLASATGGVVTGSLVVNLFLLGVLVVVLILRIGRLRPYDVGLIRRNVLPGAGAALLLWAAAQAIHLLVGWFNNGSIALHPDWTMVGAGALVGLLLSQIIGNALFEEIAYRGFLFPQLYLQLQRRLRSPWARLFVALLVSQVLFALSHIPNRLYLGMSFSDLLLDQVMLLGWGVLYALLYLRTDNLFFVVGIHALGNAPTTLFATIPALDGAGASLLIYGLAVLVVFGWPLVRPQKVPSVSLYQSR